MKGVLHPVLALVLANVRTMGGDAVPTDWIDPDTGHRIIRLSSEDNSSSLYFHQNTYTPQGDKMIFDTPSGIGAVDLTTLGSKPPKVDVVVVGGRALAMARKTREVYFVRNFTLCAANVDTHAVREVAPGRPTAINCDETFMVRTVSATDATGKVTAPAPRVIPPQRERMFAEKLKANISLTHEEELAAKKEDRLSWRLADPRCQAFEFTNLKTKQSVTNGYQYAWLNHLQFSPTDPNLLLYCHEGTWHEVERIWTIRTY